MAATTVRLKKKEEQIKVVSEDKPTTKREMSRTVPCSVIWMVAVAVNHVDNLMATTPTSINSSPLCAHCLILPRTDPLHSSSSSNAKSTKEQTTMHHKQLRRQRVEVEVGGATGDHPASSKRVVQAG